MAWNYTKKRQRKWKKINTKNFKTIRREIMSNVTWNKKRKIKITIFQWRTNVF